MPSQAVQNSASGRSQLISPKPVSGPRGSAEGLKDYFRVADNSAPIGLLSVQIW